jgi:hypothetical protein
MKRPRLLWALALLFVSDLAMPTAPGAFQLLEGQSVEIARRLPLQATTAVVPLPSLQPRSTPPAPPSPRIATARREAAPRPFVVPFVRSQVEADVSAVDDPDPA